MIRFRYRAARSDGRVVSGALSADTVGAASALLRDRGLLPVAVRPDPAMSRARTANRHQLAVVFRSLASLVSAGLPVERAVAATLPLAHGRLNSLLSDAHQAIHEGASVGAALGAGNGVVPSVVIGMVRAGERAGRLALALDRAATHLEQEAELLGKLRQSLAYPAMLAITGTVSILVIGTVVVPRFATLLADLGQSLPLSTRFLLAGSALITRYGLAFLALSVALGLAARQAASRPVLVTRLHELLLRVPAIGSVRLSLSSARFCRALSSTLESGMTVLPALAAGIEAAGDIAVAARLDRARERVARGQPMAASLTAENAIAPVCAQLLAVGEAGGRLAELADRAADVAAGEGERALRTVVAVIEPLFIVSFGGIVIFVATALLQAVYGLRP